MSVRPSVSHVGDLCVKLDRKYHDFFTRRNLDIVTMHAEGRIRMTIMSNDLVPKFFV